MCVFFVSVRNSRWPSPQDWTYFNSGLYRSIDKKKKFSETTNLIEYKLVSG